jgi:hypothetical protein
LKGPGNVAMSSPVPPEAAGVLALVNDKPAVALTRHH